MRNFTLDSSSFNKMTIIPYNIIAARTSALDFEMDRQILLKNVDGLNYSQGEEFLLLEGWHCSCYDFDEISWDATAYTESELKKLAMANYNLKDEFWSIIREYFNLKENSNG